MYLKYCTYLLSTWIRNECHKWTKIARSLALVVAGAQIVGANDRFGSLSIHAVFMDDRIFVLFPEEQRVRCGRVWHWFSTKQNTMYFLFSPIAATVCETMITLRTIREITAQQEVFFNLFLRSLFTLSRWRCLRQLKHSAAALVSAIGTLKDDSLLLVPEYFCSLDANLLSAH